MGLHEQPAKRIRLLDNKTIISKRINIILETRATFHHHRIHQKTGSVEILTNGQGPLPLN